MSATTKKKHVTKEVLEDYPLPNVDRQVVKVTAARGNNLHEVVSSKGDKFLVSMPSKFRKHVWIKRGDYIMVDPIEEGDKVKGEICHILFKDQIKFIRDQGLWPDNFNSCITEQNDAMVPDNMLPPSDSEDSDNDLGDMVISMNRARVTYEPSESEEEESSGDEDENRCDSSNRGRQPIDSIPSHSSAVDSSLVHCKKSTEVSYSNVKDKG